MSRQLRRVEKLRETEWLAEHLEHQTPRDPAVVAAEDRDIAARRAAFPLH